MQQIARKAWRVKRLRKKLQEYKGQCETCIKNKNVLGESFGFLSRLEPVKEPFDVVSIDSKGGFSVCISTKKYIYLVIDHATRFVWAVTAKCQGENDLCKRC